MYLLPSTSVIIAPSPCATNTGSTPTLRHARTGEFTPPGITCFARSKIAWLRWMPIAREPNADRLEPAPSGCHYMRMGNVLRAVALVSVVSGAAYAEEARAPSADVYMQQRGPNTLDVTVVGESPPANDGL